MKNIICLCLLAITLSNMRAQNDGPSVNLGFFAEAGYNSFKLDEVRNAYNDIVNEYAAYGINVRTQDLFSGSAVYGGGLHFALKDQTKIKVGFNITGTEASSRYNGYSGTLNMACEASVFNFYLGFQKKIADWGKVNPVVDFNLILGSSECEYTAKVSLINGETLSARETFSASSIYFQPAFGLSFDAAPVEIILKSGYKLLAFKDINKDDSSSLEIDMGGFFLSTSISVTLPND